MEYLRSFHKFAATKKITSSLKSKLNFHPSCSFSVSDCHTEDWVQIGCVNKLTRSVNDF